MLHKYCQQKFFITPPIYLPTSCPSWSVVSWTLHYRCFTRPAVKDTQLHRRSTITSNQSLLDTTVEKKKNSHPISTHSLWEQTTPSSPSTSRTHILMQWCISHLMGWSSRLHRKSLIFLLSLCVRVPSKALFPGYEVTGRQKASNEAQRVKTDLGTASKRSFCTS